MQDAEDLDRRRDARAEERLRERLVNARSPEARVTALTESTDLSPHQAEDLVGRFGDDFERLASEAFRYREG
jgi:hypothetical protein